MKKIFLFLTTALLTLSACEGPQGPAGPPGYSAESFVYEITNVDFMPNDYAILFEFPQTLLQSDHVLVYRLSSTFQGEDVWQLLPQTYYFSDGTLDFAYNYDHTRFDVNVFIEGNDLGTLSSNFTQNQILRFVVIPGQFSKAAMAKNDYKSVTEALGLNESDVVKVTR
jgi:hypothetical protein